MSAARHEAAHAVAVYLFDLADVLRPGGAAIRQDGGGAVILDRPEYTARDCLLSSEAVEVIPPCRLAIAVAHERPDLAPAILLFLVAGYGATPETWRGRIVDTAYVRVSPDLATARQIIMDLAGGDSWAVYSFASEAAFDSLLRAVEWAALPHVRTMIDAAAAYLEAHGAASWLELETIFFATAETSRGGTLATSAAVPGVCPVEGTALGTATANPPAAVVALVAENKTEQNEVNRK